MKIKETPPHIRKHEPGGRCLGPIADLEKHLPSDWWRTLFNSLYIKTDSDVVENEQNTAAEIDLLISLTQIEPFDNILDLCCGQGRHAIELAKRGYTSIVGIDRSRFLIRLARKRATFLDTKAPRFSEGDARRIRHSKESFDCVFIMGNSFGYFEKEEDDHRVMQEVNRILKSQGKLLIDITDGEWMSQNYDKRSWEWIDQSLLVCRERKLAADSRRLITREVVIDSEKGVIADQFYAERLYSYQEIKELLESVGFNNINRHQDLKTFSTRNQDLGMMANRIVVTATAPVKAPKVVGKAATIECTVLMGDPRLPDKVKRGGQFNPEDMETINILKSALKKLDKFHFTYWDNHKTLVKNLMQSPPQFVFNLCDEGYMNDANKELHIPSLLEMLEIPYTGCGPACLAMCYNKALVRAIAQDMGIPVPDEIWIDPSNQTAALPSIFPAIVKPALGDSSIGITQKAVVRDAEALVSYFDWIFKELPGTPILIQEFLSGREFSVGVIGNEGALEALPVLEVDYSKLPPDLPKILGYESKWDPDSPYWNDISYHLADLNEEQLRSMIDNSFALFERLGCRDYVRFDFREDSHGRIKLLEVNPNPGWCWDGKFNKMAAFGGIEYHQMLEKILLSALERFEMDRNKQPAKR